MQHVNIKLFAEQPYPKRIAGAIPVFHRWIQQRSLPGVLIDVADYAHVPNGPGVLLVAHEFDVGLDEAQGRLGVLYNRKLPTDEIGVESLRSAYRFALGAAERLESEPEFAGELRFHRDRLQVTLNDRLLYPNTDETAAALQSDFDAFFEEVLGSKPSSVERNPDPRARFSVTAIK